MKLIATVRGIKNSKGIMRDTGKEYDSTTLYIEMPFDESGGNMRGCATEAFKYGTSDNYKQFEGIELPFDAEIDLQVVTNGNKLTQMVTQVTPLKKPTKQPEAAKA